MTKLLQLLHKLKWKQKRLKLKKRTPKYQNNTAWNFEINNLIDLIILIYCHS